MYLRSLTLREFAGVSQLTLDRFEDGLNVVVGDNEAGKSTVLTALRPPSSRSIARAARRRARWCPTAGRSGPRSRSPSRSAAPTTNSARPSFRSPRRTSPGPAGGCRATPWRASRRTPALHAFGGAQAEGGRLCRHVRPPLGRPGRSTEGLDLGAGRDAVTASLEGEVSQVLGGERGRALLAAARARQERFFTETLRAKAGSPLREAEERLERAREELSQRRAALAEYRSKLQRLSDRRSVLRSYEKDDALAQAASALARAEADQRQLGDLRRDCSEAERELKHALSLRDHAGERLRRREALLAALAKATGQAEEEQARLAEHRVAVDRERRHVAELEGTLALARDALKTAEAEADAARLADERARLRDQIARLDAQVAEGRRLATQLEAASRAGDGRVPTRRDLGELEETERACREAEIRLSAASPTVTFARTMRMPPC